MNVAEEVVFRLCLEDKVQDFRRTEVLVQNAQRRIMCDKDVKVGGNVLVGNAGISGDGADNDAVTVFHSILKNDDTFIGHCLLYGFGLSKVKGQFVIARNEDLPFGFLGREPVDEVLIFATLEVVFHRIPGANEDIYVLRHHEVTMMAMGVGEDVHNSISYYNQRCFSI